LRMIESPGIPGLDTLIHQFLEIDAQ